MRILYLPTYQELRPSPSTSSDAIGYGVTSSNALVSALRSRGCDVRIASDAEPTLHLNAPPSFDRARAGQRALLYLLDDVATFRPDVIFIFHTFNTPAALIRKILLDAGIRLPLIGYLHGSHWDATDTFRLTRYPGLKWLDFANLTALDAALVVSEAFIEHLREAFLSLPPVTYEAVCRKLNLVPLPIATDLMDQHSHNSRSRERAPQVTFNHAPIQSKRPDIFARVMDRVMSEFPVTSMFTRRFINSDFGADAVLDLQVKYGERVVLGDDLDIQNYYRALWASDFQVSTATHETLGIATLEAMYTENCCILPDIPTYREISANCRAALYRPGDEELYRAIVAHIQNPIEAKAVAAQLKEASRKYTADVIVEQLLPVLERATASKEGFGL
jgi:glycosyltransferase involved in cell wall biosynthesis